MSLRDAQNYVRAFHQKFGVAAPGKPVDDSAVDWEAHVRRAFWIIDEAHEIIDACDRKNMADLVDGYGDVEYFALGGNVELGVDGQPVFEAIHAKNMEKVRIPGAHKIGKPPGWTPPNIGALIEEQRRK